MSEDTWEEKKANGRNCMFELFLGAEDAEGFIHSINVQEVDGEFHTTIGVTEHLRVLFRKADVLKFAGIVFADNSFTILPKKLA